MDENILQSNRTPWVSFCMSTYRRPEFLRKQLLLLLTQTFTDFEIVISDNDPVSSAEKIVYELNDRRIRYFKNGNNIGMINSFNKSIERSRGDFIVMVTDDDPVVPEFLCEMRDLVEQDNRYALYGGFVISGIAHGEKKIIPANIFIQEILDPSKTKWMLWSSCMIRRDKLAIKKIPDYESPHLADHAMIALAGSYGGGMIFNKKFSSLTSHESNFSKFNFDCYVQGCKGFYDVFRNNAPSVRNLEIVRKHLFYWFIANFFNLKRYYSVSVPDAKMLKEVNECAKQILEFDFMRGVIFKYRMKNITFKLKKAFGLLKRK
jgi:glycosyltransferase involved in cell wall biosynthesis